MNVYVAGRFIKKADVREVQQILRAAGHRITEDWTLSDDTALSGGELVAYWEKSALNDVDGVISADAIVIVPEWDGCGLFIEMGVMLGLYRLRQIYGADFSDLDTVIGKKRIIVIGDREKWMKRTVFFSMPIVEYTTKEQLVWLLGTG